MRNPGRRRGFTLIELMVVVAIIALLVGILIPSLLEARNQSQAVACANNMRQGVNGTILALVEAGMKKERWSTNFGWAVHSLRRNNGQSEIFTCPADPDPKPIPAVFDRIWLNGNFMGTSSGDAVFNRVKRLGNGTWITDIQDQVIGDMFGGDAYSEPTGDCLVQYTVTKGQHFADATVSPDVTNRVHNGYSYKGEQLWENTSTGGGTVRVPILWMSYGANASAGLQNVKGTPALIVEAGKLGVFPEAFGQTSQGTHHADHLGKSLRFRHGGKASVPGLGGRGSDFTQQFHQPSNAYDANYEAHAKANVAFLDGHVERLGYYQMFTLDPTNPENVKPIPNRMLWVGMRRGEASSF